MTIKRLKIRNLGTGNRSFITKVVVESFSTNARKRMLSHTPDWIRCRITLAKVAMTHTVNAQKLVLGGLVKGFAFNDGRFREG